MAFDPGIQNEAFELVDPEGDSRTTVCSNSAKTKPATIKTDPATEKQTHGTDVRHIAEGVILHRSSRRELPVRQCGGGEKVLEHPARRRLSADPVGHRRAGTGRVLPHPPFSYGDHVRADRAEDHLSWR